MPQTTHFRVRNWSRFQHYHARRPPWIKLYRELLDDPEYHALAPAVAKYLPLVWLVASENDGDLPDLATLAFRLRVAPGDCSVVLAGLAPWIEEAASNALAPCTQPASTPLALARSRETKIDKDNEAEENAGKPNTRTAVYKFIKPTIEQVAEYCRQRKNGIDAAKFVDYYTANGWMIGKNSMKDWQAAIRNWEKRDSGSQKTGCSSTGLATGQKHHEGTPLKWT